MTKKVLVTGGNGFIGRWVVSEFLNKNYEVHLIVHNELSPSDLSFFTNKEKLFFYKLNLLDYYEVDNFFKDHSFENLIHLAWYVGPKCHSSNNNLDWVNATLNLLKMFKESGGKVFLGAGTCSEYEYKYGYLTESLSSTNSGTLYGNGKNAVFTLAEIFCRQNGIIFKWPRIFNLYGPNEKKQRLVPNVIISCLKNTDIKVSDCLKFQDYLHVQDTAKGIVCLFESNLQGACNISSGIPVRLKEIVNKITEFTDFKGNVLWGAIPASFDYNFVVGNNEKLKSTGWRQEISLEKGLKDTIEWWKNHYV